MTPLTEKQAAVLAAISRRRLVHDVTYRELMREFGWKSPQAVSCHIKALADKGYIAIQEGRRGIQVLKQSEAGDGEG
jgi:SOS-response transcriptional repressor LexA